VQWTYGVGPVACYNKCYDQVSAMISWRHVDIVHILNLRDDNVSPLEDVSPVRK